MSLTVKLCGLSTEETIDAVLEAGADYLGFVFYPRSPRSVTLARAADLARRVHRPVRLCGLFVDAEDAAIGRVLDAVPLDLIQLHGAELPERCAALRSWSGRPVMKALKIAGPEDVAEAERWLGAVDLLLFDAKPADAAALPGGNGIPFDWDLLAGRDWRLPWLLSGGLTAGNLAAAVRRSGATGVDVSSGVETSPGIKDPRLIREFIAVARALG